MSTMDDEISVSPNKEDESAPFQDFDETKTISKTNRKSLFAQCVVTAVTFVATVGGGMPVGYSAVLLPQLNSSLDESFGIDDQMGSWIASIHSAANPVGSLLSGTAMDYLGRKLALQLSNVPLIVGWFLIAVSPNHAVILIGRVFAGLTVGLQGTVVQVYVAEIADPHLRGVLGSVPFSSYSFGILLIYVMGSVLHWRLVAGICVLMQIVSALLYFFLPESPAWLVRQGRLEDAHKSCLRLRGGDVVQTQLEIDQLVKRVEREELRKYQKGGESAWRYLMKPHVLKPLFIVNIFNLLQTLSGVYVIVFYAVDVISCMGNTSINKCLAAVLTGIVRLIFAAIASFLLGITGRRVVGVGSALGTGISAGLLATILYVGSSWNGHFATVCLMVYVGVSTLGLMILPGVLVGELYPIRIRGLAGGITVTAFNLIMFSVTKAYPFVKIYLGMANVFVLFGVSAFATAAFVYLFLPETKGVPLNDIEEYFEQNTLLWMSREKLNIGRVSRVNRAKNCETNDF